MEITVVEFKWKTVISQEALVTIIQGMSEYYSHQLPAGLPIGLAFLHITARVFVYLDANLVLSPSFAQMSCTTFFQGIIPQPSICLRHFSIVLPPLWFPKSYRYPISYKLTLSNDPPSLVLLPCLSSYTGLEDFPLCYHSRLCLSSQENQTLYWSHLCTWRSHETEAPPEISCYAREWGSTQKIMGAGHRTCESA